MEAQTTQGVGSCPPGFTHTALPHAYTGQEPSQAVHFLIHRTKSLPGDTLKWHPTHFHNFVTLHLLSILHFYSSFRERLENFISEVSKLNLKTHQYHNPFSRSFGFLDPVWVRVSVWVCESVGCPTPINISGTSSGSYSSTQFWHSLPGDKVRWYKLRPRTCKTVSQIDTCASDLLAID